MSLSVLVSNIARAHAASVHENLLPLARHPGVSHDELARDIEHATQRHAERLGVQLPHQVSE
ncbi:hypothetical protein G4D37_24725 [Burkholderia pseudomallei]|uniref:hypothetical protein n=1 Tax=Burkholderia pseudomallei TaxID=28450 RepID=UPI001593C778|nr:hypothetical protein [Burkholderia pseudomallei]NVH69341.1 hypothetical protein [Burkholderia pseudomallei]